MAAPAHEGKHSLTVALVVDVLGCSPDLLETDGVHVHVLHICHFLSITLVGVAKEDVVCPAGTLYEHLLAIEDETSVAVLVEI